MLTQMVRLPLSDVHFRRISQLIYQRAGIVLAEHKREMVYNRLGAPFAAVGIARFRRLPALLESDPNSAEWQAFINALTTNLTAFFREAHHFPILGGARALAAERLQRLEHRSLDRRRTVFDRHHAERCIGPAGRQLPGLGQRHRYAGAGKSGGGRLPPGRSAHPDADPNAALFSARHRAASGAGARAAGAGGAGELSAAEPAGAEWALPGQFDAIFAATSRSISIRRRRSASCAASFPA